MNFKPVNGLVVVQAKNVSESTENQRRVILADDNKLKTGVVISVSDDIHDNGIPFSVSLKPGDYIRYFDEHVEFNYNDDNGLVYDVINYLAIKLVEAK